MLLKAAPNENYQEQQEQQKKRLQQPPPPPPPSPQREASPVQPAPPEALIGARRKLQKLKQLPIEKQLSETRKPIRRQAPRSQIIEEKLRKEKPWPPSSSPAEKQLKRAKAMERKIAEKRMVEEQKQPHWRQENIAEPISKGNVGGQTGRAVEEAALTAESIALTSARGWLRKAREFETMAYQEKAKAKVEVEQAKLSPHLQEELGTETVPSYKPNIHELYGWGYALASSTSAFTAGVLTGFVDVAMPWRILREAREFLKDPAGSIKNTAKVLMTDPLAIPFTTGRAVGTYLGFKALGKGISKIAGKKKVTYELIPEKTEGKVVFNDKMAILKLKHSGKAVKVPGGSSTGAADIASTPKFQYVNVEASGLHGRIQISGGRIGPKGILYMARDIVKPSRLPKKPAKWTSEEFYLLVDESATKSIALDLLLRARSLKGAPSAGTAISATPSASLIQELLGKTLFTSRMSRTVTILEPRLDINLSPGAALSLLQPIEDVVKATEKMRAKKVEETKLEPSATPLTQPLRGQLPQGKPRAKSKTPAPSISSKSTTVNTLSNILEADIKPLKSYRSKQLLKQLFSVRKASAHARKLRQHYRRLLRNIINIKEEKLRKLDEGMALLSSLTPKNVPKKGLGKEPRIELDIPQELMPTPRIDMGTSLTQLTQLLLKQEPEKPRRPRSGRTPSGTLELPWPWPVHRRGYTIFRKRMEGYFERLWRFLTPQKLLGLKIKKKRRKRRR